MNPELFDQEKLKENLEGIRTVKAKLSFLLNHREKMRDPSTGLVSAPAPFLQWMETTIQSLTSQEKSGPSTEEPWPFLDKEITLIRLIDKICERGWLLKTKRDERIVAHFCKQDGTPYTKSSLSTLRNKMNNPTDFLRPPKEDKEIDEIIDEIGSEDS